MAARRRCAYKLFGTDGQTDGQTDGRTEKFNTISLRFTGDNVDATLLSECRTLSRKPHDRRTNDRRQKTAVFLIAGHFAKYGLLDKSPQIDLFRQPHFFNFYSTDVVHISEDIIVVMNLCL